MFLPQNATMVTIKPLINTFHFVMSNCHVTSHVSLVSSDFTGHGSSTVYKQHHYNLNITTTFSYHS